MKLAVFALLAGCTSRDVVATTSPTGGDVPSYCLGKGPPIIVGDGVTVGENDGNPDDVCTGDVAVQTFTHALCTCEGYATSTMLTTDSFDSSTGPYVPGGTMGDVGIVGALQANAILSIGGALTVEGPATFLADASVRTDLAVDGALGSSSSDLTCGGNARVASNIDLASFMVAGTLTYPSTATATGTITAGATTRAPVAIDPPCGCGPNDLVDIAAFVASPPMIQNDAIGLARDRLANHSDAATIDLPCGVYALTEISGSGSLTLRISGRVALLVNGDANLGSPLAIELVTDDAELDLFIAGLLSSNNRLMIGNDAHPSNTRIYIGGSGTINLSGDSHIAANVYAPSASIALSAPAEIFGSLFVKRLDQAAPVMIHYDVDVRRADVGCFQ